MATKLDVVNDCLATLGEAPLNTLQEPHEFKGTALRLLTRTLARVQATGWWYNTEDYTAKPVLSGDGVLYIQLPGDCLKFRSGTKSRDTLIQQKAQPWIVQRGLRLYDTVNRTYNILEEVTGEIVRDIPFEDLPSEMQDYVAADVVLKFQSDFDADNSKRQELTQAWQQARSMARAEDIRQNRVNMHYNNARLQLLKSRTRRIR